MTRSVFRIGDELLGLKEVTVGVEASSYLKSSEESFNPLTVTSTVVVVNVPFFSGVIQ